MAPGGQERLRRRKITLACEPCRERKSRCDGFKPICSSCQRRSLGLERCVYKADNARTAITDEYIKVLHDRIRRLEQACVDNNVDVPSLDPGIAVDEETSSQWSAENRRLPSHVRGQLTSATSTMDQSVPTNYLDLNSREPSLTLQVSPNNRVDPNDPSCTPGNVTAMGTITTENDSSGAEDFYGSSSTASFLKEAFESMKLPQTRVSIQALNLGSSTTKDNLPSGRRDAAYYVQAQNYSLPPRDLADHLLDRYRQHVYYLYPFFHLPSFEHAYRSLWQPNNEPAPSPLNLGLGCPQEADANTILFHCALNAIFSHACHFSDLPPADRLTASNTFFLRAKSFVGLDLTEMNNLALVQVLLLIALALQSTPYPSRCWNATGLACRVAQGLGLHTEYRQDNRQDLEKEIRHRTWYGCVMMDMYVSMTYGRPAMTTMVSSLPLPSGIDETPLGLTRGQQNSNHCLKFSFYVESIRLCGMLEEILSQVYQPWLSRGTTGSPQSTHNTKAYNSLDTVIGLHTKLFKFEESLPPELCWKKQVLPDGLSAADKALLETQKTVLRARFLYLRIMLLRPLLTQLTVDERERASSGTATIDPLVVGTTLHCAKSCVQTAAELLRLIHSTSQTQPRGAWWWDALYACTSGIVMIIARTCPSLWSTLDSDLMAASWQHCQEILKHVASFSESGQQLLKLLQTIHNRTCSIESNDKDNPPPSPHESISTDVANAILHSMPLDFNVDFNLSGATGFQGFGDMDMMGSFFNLDTSVFGNQG